MNKKEAIIPIAFFALSFAFVVVCTMVFLSNGKSKKWINLKMEIGGLLLSFSKLFSNCDYEKLVLCYSSAAIDTKAVVFKANNFNPGHAEINKKNPQSIVGSFSPLKEYNLSFQICDSTGNPLQTGRLVDGYNYNFISGDFELILDKILHPGKYWIKIYTCSIENQLQEKPAIELNLTVTDE